jgi:hypothetical protein
MARTSHIECRHDHVKFVIHRIGERRHVYSQCLSCGQEWTSTEEVNDLAEPVSSSETIAVHELLDSGKSLKELVE